MDFVKVARLLKNNALRPGRVLRAYQAIQTGQPFRERITIEEGIKITVVPPDYTSTCLYLGEQPSGDIIGFMDAFLRLGMTVFDVGAHIGHISIHAARRVGGTGKVVAFEPIKELHEIFEENTRPYPQVRLEKTAVGSIKDASVDLNFYGPKWYGHTTARTPRIGSMWSGGIPEPEKRTVPCQSLDKFVHDTRIVPDFVKIDVEGLEMDVLRGAEMLIRRYKPTIIIEGGDMGRAKGETTRDTLHYLERRDYCLYERRAGKIVPHVLQNAYEKGCDILCMR